MTLEHIPTSTELQDMIGAKRFAVWTALCERLDARYDMERLWASGGKRWTYEYKYRRGGKTLCALYAKPDDAGLMMIFGKDEREKVEALRAELPARTLATYDEATTYHDGKWAMFALESVDDLDGYMLLLGVKRKPNRKAGA